VTFNTTVHIKTYRGKTYFSLMGRVHLHGGQEMACNSIEDMLKRAIGREGLGIGVIG
jgi:hypothetical protein